MVTGAAPVMFDVGLSKDNMRPTVIKWSVGTVVFSLPGLLGLIGDALGRSPATNGSRLDESMPSMFVLSLILAAGVCAGIIVTAPISFGRRLGFVAAVWSMLLAEAWLTIVWSLRGLH
jgi:hypothetical protein